MNQEPQSVANPTKTTVINGYLVTGNKHIAIAMYVEDAKDVHTFVPDHLWLNDAYEQAVAWTSPGI